MVQDNKNNIKIPTALIVGYGISAAAGIGAVVYNIKTGGGFWRGVGYFVLASVVVGIPVTVVSRSIAYNKSKK